MKLCLVFMMVLAALCQAKSTTSAAGKLEGFKRQETGAQEDMKEKRNVVQVSNTSKSKLADLLAKYKSLQLNITSLETRLSQLTNKVNGRKVHCINKYTGWDSYSDAPIMFLDRQHVYCPHGYFVSSFVLRRQGNGNHSNVRYIYQCCKLRF